MPGGIGQHVERFVGIVSAIKQDPTPDGLGTFSMSLKFGDAGDGEVHVHLHRNRLRRPRRCGRVTLLLNRHDTTAFRAHEHKPISRVGAALGRLIPLAVAQTQETTLELRQSSAVNRFDGSVYQLRELASFCIPATHVVAHATSSGAISASSRARRSWARCKAYRDCTFSQYCGSMPK